LLQERADGLDWAALILPLYLFNLVILRYANLWGVAAESAAFSWRITVLSAESEKMRLSSVFAQNGHTVPAIEIPEKMARALEVPLYLVVGVSLVKFMDFSADPWKPVYLTC
jgi:hypothetical protein